MLSSKSKSQKNEVLIHVTYLKGVEWKDIKNYGYLKAHYQRARIASEKSLRDIELNKYLEDRYEHKKQIQNNAVK